MQFDWITFGLQLVNVLVLLALLRHFLFRPVAAIIGQRQAETQRLLQEAETARAEADRAAAAARAEAEATAAARQALLQSARTEADTEGQRLLAAARTEAQKLLAGAEDSRKAAAQATEAVALRRASLLARSIAERALSGMPDPPSLQGFAARLATALAALPEGTRQALLQGAGLRLVAPHPPDAAELAAIAARLDLPGLAVETDPALIAGLDLRSAGGVLHNSLAHDLSRIAKALDDGDTDRR